MTLRDAHNDEHSATPPRKVTSVVIRFAGDSGDGMQLTGTRFSESAAMFGNDIATLPDFPAEIRAPAGSLPGVSGFQIQIADHDVFTAGDQPDVLVAMNPAALKRNLRELRAGGTIVFDIDQFTEKNLARAGFTTNPSTDHTFDAYVTHPVRITALTIDAVAEVTELTARERERARNLFALGLTLFMFNRSLEPTQRWIARTFGAETPEGRANGLALQKGYDYGVTAELGAGISVPPARDIAPGTYRSITGNLATAYGFAAAAHCAKRELVLASYPITPASDILHTLSGLKRFGIRTLQAEDEIAAACMAIGASWGGAIGLTTSSGPGIALKSESMSLAVSAELPLVVVNVQRAGPSTGMPTRVEQADLLMALHGRHGESPVVVVAPSSPSDCFDMAIEAVRLATRYMTPVVYLSDAYLANGAEPWRVPTVEELPDIAVPNAVAHEGFRAFAHDPDTLARPWAVPGTPGLEHRIGGLEKQAGTGNISYDAANHDAMCHLRARRIAQIANDIPLLEVRGDADAELLVLGWGSTAGAIHTAVDELRARGVRLAYAHIRHLNPLPSNTGAVLGGFGRVLVCEVNLGQLAALLRAEFALPIQSYARATGTPFGVAELTVAIAQAVEPATSEGAR